MLFVFVPLVVASLVATLVPAHQVPVPPSVPRAPRLEWLFTVDLATVPNAAPLLPGPNGIRLDLAITGGTARLRGGVHGTMRGDTADWAVVDPRTGIAQADARWTLALPATPSTDGLAALVFVESTGPSQKRGGLARAHLRLKLETGVPEYYWLNNVCAVGVLDILNPSNTSIQDVHIEAFNFVDDWAPEDKVFTCLYEHGDDCDTLS
ncbi:hypothetical protein JCM11491_007145 [Sporobolomyces phaffii]